MPQLVDADIAVVAVSVDQAAEAEAMAAKCSASFPVGYGLDLMDTARQLGAFYEERRSILHATGFLLTPAGKTSVSCYSSGAIGRLDPDSVLRLVEHFRRQEFEERAKYSGSTGSPTKDNQ